MGWRSKSMFLIVASAGWLLFTGAAVAEEVGDSIGSVKIDAFAAEVRLQDATDESESFFVTIRGVRSKDASPVRAKRVKIWLLRSHFQSGGPALALEDYPEQQNLPEQAVESGIEVTATFQFASRGLHREHMFAVVVAIDDETHVLKVTGPNK